MLSFACGTGRLPAEGFRALTPPFRLDFARGEPPENLPCAHTCFNQLCLPAYQTEEDLRRKLALAINYAADGFGFA